MQKVSALPKPQAGKGSKPVKSLANINRSAAVFYFSPAVATVLIFIVIFSGLESFLFRLPSLYWKKKNIFEVSIRTAEVVILGSSHTFFGIRPDKIDVPAINLANVSQSLDIDEQIMNKFLAQASRVKIVILPISYFSLEQRLIDGPEEWRDCLYYKFFNVAERDFWHIATDPRYWFLSAYYGPARLRTILTGDLAAIIVCDTDKSGWALHFDLLHAPKTWDSGRKRVELSNKYMHGSLLIAHQQLLKRVVENCRRRDIKVLIITTPVYKTYQRFANQGMLAIIRQTAYDLTMPGQVAYANYFADSRFTSEDFADNDHLSKTGATKFTAILNREFIKPLLQKK